MVVFLQIWILEVSTQSLRWWSKDLDLIPRALSWSKVVPFQRSDDFGQLFPEASVHFVHFISYPWLSHFYIYA